MTCAFWLVSTRTDAGLPHPLTDFTGRFSSSFLIGLIIFRQLSVLMSYGRRRGLYTCARLSADRIVSLETGEISWRGLNGDERPAATTRRCTSTKRLAWHGMLELDDNCPCCAVSAAVMYTVDVNVDQYWLCSVHCYTA